MNIMRREIGISGKVLKAALALLAAASCTCFGLAQFSAGSTEGDNVHLFPLECNADFQNLFLLNDNTKTNLEFLVALNLTYGGNSQLGAAFNSYQSRAVAAGSLAAMTDKLYEGYLTYEACELAHGAQVTWYPLGPDELVGELEVIQEALLADPYRSDELLDSLQRLTGWKTSGHGCLIANMDRINMLINSVAGEEDMNFMVPGVNACHDKSTQSDCNKGIRKQDNQ
jgi:hypothetical protein